MLATAAGMAYNARMDVPPPIDPAREIYAYYLTLCASCLDVDVAPPTPEAFVDLIEAALQEGPPLPASP